MENSPLMVGSLVTLVDANVRTNPKRAGVVLCENKDGRYNVLVFASGNSQHESLGRIYPSVRIDAGGIADPGEAFFIAGLTATGDMVSTVSKLVKDITEIRELITSNLEDTTNDMASVAQKLRAGIETLAQATSVAVSDRVKKALETGVPVSAPVEAAKEPKSRKE